MAESFADWPEAVPTTLEIAERCDVEIELGKLLLPRFPTAGRRGARGDAAPARRRGPARAATATRRRPRRVERLEFELGVIEEMGFESYFLIVWDFVSYAKENGIAVGPGRGSAAGSIVAYALNITDLDPLANDLLFERFLNPARKSMPDIDIDFSVRGRERVIRYVGEKYGRESVAQIITFGKMAPRAGDPRRRPRARLRLRHRRPAREADPGADHGPQPELRGVPEAGRGAAQGLRRRARRAADRRRRPGPRGDRPQQLDPRRRGRDRRPAAARDRARCSSPRTAAPPARATATSGKPERQYKIVTQYSMGPIEEIGLLKMDFLGLRNLDVIEDAVEIIERSRGESRSTSRRSRSTTPRPTRCSPAATRSASSSSSPRACARR